jgi:hypothetical protein
VLDALSPHQAAAQPVAGGEIATAGVGQVRGPVRDAMTLFDENAALLQAPDALWDALLARDWTRLFVDLRPLWAQARLVLFGHALLEKLVRPTSPSPPTCYREPVPLALGDDLAAWDAWLAAHLTPPLLAAKPFTPLPVLGVPGWWPANASAGFYDDTAGVPPAASCRLNLPESAEAALGNRPAGHYLEPA